MYLCRLWTGRQCTCVDCGQGDSVPVYTVDRATVYLCRLWTGRQCTCVDCRQGDSVPVLTVDRASVYLCRLWTRRQCTCVYCGQGDSVPVCDTVWVYSRPVQIGGRTTLIPGNNHTTKQHAVLLNPSQTVTCLGTRTRPLKLSDNYCAQYLPVATAAVNIQLIRHEGRPGACTV